MLIRIKVTYYIDCRDFHGRAKPRNTENKNLKRDTVGNLIALYEIDKWFIKFLIVKYSH